MILPHHRQKGPEEHRSRTTSLTPDSAYQRRGTKPDFFVVAAPARAAGMPSLGGSWLGGGKGAEKHRPLRNFFFLLALPKGAFYEFHSQSNPRFVRDRSPRLGNRMENDPREEGTCTRNGTAVRGGKACGSPWASRSTSSKTQAKKAISNAVPRTLVNPLVVAATGQSLSMDG